jgi:signal transduction histidine kinase
VFWDLGLVPDEEIAGVRAVADGSLGGADVLGFENHWRHRDGSLRLFRWTNAPLRDAAGVVRYVVASAIDITERRAAEVREREQQEALAHMHRVHMAGELAALLAHEINQPLTAIASYSEAGLRGTASGARDAGRVIQDLRAFLAKRSATIAAFDVAETMRRARELAAPYARDHGVRIELELGGAPRALADAIQVEQIIVSLIRNAIESIDGAGMASGCVTLRLAEREGSAEITVEDSGPGVHPDDVERLFEPFFTTKPEGMGMGLRISRTLAMANDGRLWAEPKAPGGAFHLTLPLAP